MTALVSTSAEEIAGVLSRAEVWVSEADCRAVPRMNGPSMAASIRSTLEAERAKTDAAKAEAVEELQAIWSRPYPADSKQNAVEHHQALLIEWSITKAALRSALERLGAPS